MAFSGRRRASEDLAEQVESAALNLVQLISRNISSPNSTVSSGSSHVSTTPPVLSRSPAIPSPNPIQSTTKAKRVQEQLTRQFPGLFQKKRKKCHPVCNSKPALFYMYALPGPTSVTPKGTEELKLAQAGLGKRQISLMDDGDHQEIESILHEEFPKLKELTGGWMFYKALGGSGQRKLSIIPTENDGYSVRLLKTASNNGKNDVLQSIKWPASQEQNLEDDDDLVPTETATRIAGFLKTFITEASPEDLKDLVKFWTGWEVPSKVMYVEWTSGRLPTAATCFEKLRLPYHYMNFCQFREDMLTCLRSVNSGFGLV